MVKYVRMKMTLNSNYKHLTLLCENFGLNIIGGRQTTRG